MLMIVDGNNMAYRALYKFTLSHEGQDTSIVYGTLRMMTSLIKKFKPDAVMFCYDGGVPAFRREILPEYKAHRKRNPNVDWEGMHWQMDVLNNQALPVHGILSVKMKDVEADDLIAQAAAMSVQPVLIITGDRDLVQCVSDNVTVHDPSHAGNDKTYTPDTVVDLTGVSEDKQVLYKLFCGDKSDGIKGVYMIGPKTALRMINEMSKLRSVEDMYLYDTWLEELDNLTLTGTQKTNFRQSPAELWKASYEVMNLAIDRVGARRSILEAVKGWKRASKRELLRIYIANGFASFIEGGIADGFSFLGKPEFRTDIRTPIPYCVERVTVNG